VTEEELELVDDEDDDDGDDEEEDEEAPGGFDFSQLLAQAQSMQQQLLDAQARAAEQVVEGQAGGGVVRIRVTGGFDFQQVTIDPSVVDPTDVEMLQDLVLAAMRDALAKINDLNQEAMGGLTAGGLGGLLP
jgi:nucleoid-associated protein EbfC